MGIEIISEPSSFSDDLEDNLSSELAGKASNPIWRVEILKALSNERLNHYLIAQDIRTKLKSVEVGNYYSLTGNPHQVLFALFSQADGHFDLKRPLLHRVFGHGLLHVFAGLIAVIWWFIVLIWVRSTAVNDEDRRSKIAIAVYDEWSNRTRHLLQPSVNLKTPPLVILVGRPRTRQSFLSSHSYRELENNWADQRILRPFNFISTIRAGKSAIQLLLEGNQNCLASGIRLDLKELVSTSFRILQGAVSSQWWKHSDLRLNFVYFGLTGLADTTQLEFAMQASGSKTVHCVHGVSEGRNFAAYSSIGIFRSAFDAQRAEVFKTYKKACWIPTKRPSSQPAGRGTLLMTSGSHPMNRSFLCKGIRDDENAIKSISEAARVRPSVFKEIVWRPHPALFRLPVSYSDALVNRARTEQFELWTSAETYSARLATFRTVVTTPSTAALDCLLAGKLPIIWLADGEDCNPIYLQFPFVVSSVVELLNVLDTFEHDTVINDNFEMVWNRIQPSGNIDTKFLLELTKTN